MGQFRTALGRLSFACGVLEWGRPFLAPMYTWWAKGNEHTTYELPRFVAAVMRHLAGQLARRRHYPCGSGGPTAGEPFRVDAKAEGQEVRIGGWLPTRGANGQLDPGASPWFSETLDRRVVPW